MGLKVKVAETPANVSATLTFDPMTLKMLLVLCAYLVFIRNYDEFC